MIKGVNHTIIEVSNPCNQYFERVLLFVRPQAEQIKPQQLQREADLLVEVIGKPPIHNPLVISRQRKNRKIKRIILHTAWWLVGLVCGYLLHVIV
ncbi:MAG: hypothetical protein IKM39_00125 [Clostridia bacterium]|nr:hypothetical protein [Clostridia bacterium]